MVARIILVWGCCCFICFSQQHVYNIISFIHVLYMDDRTGTSYQIHSSQVDYIVHVVHKHTTSTKMDGSYGSNIKLPQHSCSKNIPIIQNLIYTESKTWTFEQLDQMILESTVIIYFIGIHAFEGINHYGQQ